MAIQGTYQGMLDYARRTGQAGTINAVRVGGYGTGSTYEFSPSGGGSNVNVKGGGSLASSYANLAEKVRQANLKREQEIRGLYGGIIGQNTKDSPFYKAGMQDIETESQRLVGEETQGLISSGLYGTTTAASVPTKVATQFTQPSRLKLEDILQQRKSEAQLGLAGFVERINEPYPDYNSLLEAYKAMGSR